MVFFHGGANQGGTAKGGDSLDPLFDGSALAARGVILVTLNYRVGVFGFFTHPELSAESPHHVSGNYALLDQIAALRWVHDNIARFGGDPVRVTVFGQSAGGADVQFLMASPLARQLFARAIEESPGSPIYPNLVESENAGVAFAKRLDAPEANSLAFLRHLSTEELLKAYSTAGRRGFAPVIDGYVVPRPPREWFPPNLPGIAGMGRWLGSIGEDVAIPLIVGSNGREGGLKHAGIGRGMELDIAARPPTQTDSLPDVLAKSIEDLYGPIGEQAIGIYRSSASSYPPHGDVETQFTTDISFRCGTEIIAAKHSARAATWQYEFTHGYEPIGAVHIWELPYVFGTLVSPAIQPVDGRLSDQIQQYWVNFAKSGDPNGPSLPAWPKVDTRESYLDFTSDGPVAKQGLRSAACKLYRQRVENSSLSKPIIPVMCPDLERISACQPK
jgi:para-nitrobenzyl esterase